MSKKSTEDFIQEATSIHSIRYDYLLVEYDKYDTKVKIICKVHGVFEQAPYHHLRGSGCRKCSTAINGEREKISLSDFIFKSNLIHNNLYDYSKVEYVNTQTKIKIVCKIHGVFEQTPNNHLKGRGCRHCAFKRIHDNAISNNSEFEEKSRKVHGDLYDYSLVDYKRATLPVSILCKKHGVFNQLPSNHLAGHNCPNCAKTSKHEIKIKKWLDEHNVVYEEEKRFDGCKGTSNRIRMPFDFYIPHLNMCIEYDGQQHYHPIYGDKCLEYVKSNDSIKTNFCKDSGIKLLRIPYWEAGKLLKILEENIIAPGIIEKETI